MNTHRQ